MEVRDPPVQSLILISSRLHDTWVTCHMLPHPSWVPHLHVNRPLYGHPLIYVGNGNLFLSANQQILIEFDKSR